ncbi:hypothetical protein LRS03_03150 [Rhizobacter sp. J219]|jgi:hypothetical protein|uniref:hypothetical protein n=1 Tax=Rhizobacter sp. J219 TaxID=2898430 RepID=UPI00215101CF|nr:hypothetical protein [Rhizobacter sp. J219]MCR5881909.1 hypothetical protein [Rhizobacter sp. J219]
MGWLLALTVAGGALLTAAPSSAERTGTTIRSVREAAKPRPVAQAAAFGFDGGAQSTTRRRDAGFISAEPRRAAPEEPLFEPWSLLAGGLSVMGFIALRRRAG